MSDDAAPVVRLRVHQFARLEGVSVRTVWFWISIGKVAAEKDTGGHRWWVVLGSKGEGVLRPDSGA